MWRSIQSNYLSIFVCQKKERSLIIMDTFKGEDNEEMKWLCPKNNCGLVIVRHNLTNKFQSLDISINQSAKKFISNKFNAWYADRVSKQLSNGVAPGDIKVSLELCDLKPLHARLVVETYNHLKHQNDSIIKGFDAAGISEAITCANDVFIGVENSFETTTEFLVVFSVFSWKHNLIWSFESIGFL